MSSKTITMHGKPALLSLYKRLLRSAQSYPSIKREGIYKSIQDEFRDNRDMDPKEEKTKMKIAVAYKGLSQLRQFDLNAMTKGKGDESSEWEIHMEQNPMPKPASRSLPDSES